MASEKGTETLAQIHCVAPVGDAAAEQYGCGMTADAIVGLSSALSSEQPPFVRYDLRVFQALRRIIRAVDIHSRKLSVAHKITGPQLACLLAVNEREPATASAVAREVHLSASTVVGILDRLEAKSLVRRERSATDRRVVHVWLTDAGRELIACAPSPLQDRLAEAMDKLPEDELAAMAESLERIVEIMEIRHIDAAPILETGPIVPPNAAGTADALPNAENPVRKTARQEEILPTRTNPEETL
jgi:DNA-binding MarR family transcriptional regulator